MRFRPRLCNVLLWGILYGYTETAHVHFVYTLSCAVSVSSFIVFYLLKFVEITSSFSLYLSCSSSDKVGSVALAPPFKRA